MQMCSRCHKRMAVVFITRLENDKQVNEGLCLKCAREMGLKLPTGDILEKMGITDEDLERMEGEMETMMADAGITDLAESVGDDGGAPAIDITKLMQGNMSEGGKKTDGKSEKKSDGKNEKKRKFLDGYCHNLTAKAAEGKLDRIVGRDRELERVIQILCRRQKNNPCLIGEPGVGKTAIAEALAQRIVDGNVPYKLSECEVYLVDLTALVAGTQFRGQFESRILGLIGEVKEAGNIILVIDEVHNIVGAGDAEGSMNAANILKPALSRGEIQVIGATTLTEYRKYIEKDAALERRFQPVTVNEPSIEDTVKILEGIKHYYESYHGINIPDETLRRAVVLSERYITDRYLPDKAIDLIDEAASHLALSSKCLSDKEKNTRELDRLKKEREAVEGENTDDAPPEKLEAKYKRLADIKSEELRLEESLRALIPQCEAVTLLPAHLAEVVEIWTGVPASTVNEDEFKKIDELEARLKKNIIGQDEAVSAVARAIKRNRAGVSYKRKPVSFIFAGPTGVGKTELVKRVAADLFSSPESLIRLDMSEYMEKHSVSRIIGAPPGYVGYDEAGQLTEKIRRRPYSVILFDEIEKAHPDVLNILLQILDDGHITDAGGKYINFENTIIIMTTNAGATTSATAGFGTTEERVDSDKTARALESFLRPEFINRIDEIITFRSLSREDFGGISTLMLEELRAALAERGIALSYTQAAADFIADRSYSVKFGARNMRRYIQTEVEDKLAEIIISSYDKKITGASVDCNGESIVITTI
ncbi:MAG: ATP-dependent Clp protease ATP-binding subunit [Clostridia bacterium]|nr:ATP-dependent Clp protease ATP-binding subunit [Clostridia bacterium]